MNIETTVESIEVERAGELVWGALKKRFTPLNELVTILVEHDGHTPVSDWFEQFIVLESGWASLANEIDATIPGGLNVSVLYRIDLRNSIAKSPCVEMPRALAVLHFSTTEDRYNWYVRINPQCEIVVIAQND